MAGVANPIVSAQAFEQEACQPQDKRRSKYSVQYRDLIGVCASVSPRREDERGKKNPARCRTKQIHQQKFVIRYQLLVRYRGGFVRPFQVIHIAI
jgi:hypothetical protein